MTHVSNDTRTHLEKMAPRLRSTEERLLPSTIVSIYGPVLYVLKVHLHCPFRQRLVYIFGSLSSVSVLFTLGTVAGVEGSHWPTGTVSADCCNRAMATFYTGYKS